MSSPYEIICADVNSVAGIFSSISSDKNLSFEAEAGFAIQSLMGSEYAMKIATQNRQSVVNAVTNIAAIGISLNPAKKQAYLVPRDGRICLDISYMGLMDLAIASGSIKWGQCRVVCAADEFEMVGIDKEPLHRFKPFSKERGDSVGVYCVVKTAEGDYLTHTMEIGDVFAIRDRSSAWIAVQAKKARTCPWVTDEGEMVKKTCVKKAYKYWPKTEQSRLENAIHYLNEQAGEGLQKDEPRRGATIRATDGAMEALDRDQQNILRELADTAQTIFAMDGVAQTLDKIKSENLDNDQTVALWSLLPSDIRSALKAEAKARDEAAKALLS